MTTIVKAADAAQFLSLIPAMFGFTPSQSVVIVPFARGRSAGGMRIDVPPDEHVDSVAATLIGMVCRVEDADAYAVVVYGDDPVSETVPHAALAAALRARADACGLRTVDALYVGPERWAAYGDPGMGGDTAALVRDDVPVEPPAGDQRSGAELPSIGLAERERTAVALRELGRAMRTLAGADGEEEPDDDRVHPTALASTLLLEDLPSFFDGCVREPRDDAPLPDWVETPTPADTARHESYGRAALIWCLQRPAVRDIGLTTWTGGMDDGDAAVDAQLRWEAGEEYPADLAARMWGEGIRPDPDRLLAALERCRDAAAAAPRAARPGPLSACAWLSWALGRMTHAEAYARQACEIEPEHGLSTIVLGMVAAGHLPDWAFRRPAAT